MKMSTFLRADDHFGHANIIPYCRRPWTSVDKMDRDLVKLHNSVVGKDDTTIFLGDVTLKSPEKKMWLKKILDGMNGKKILVFGNHDRWHWEHYLDVGFQSCHTILQLDSFMPGPWPVKMCHDPAWAQSRDGLWVCGHLHNRAFKAPTNVAIVCVELTDYKPVPLQEIIDGRRPGA